MFICLMLSITIGWQYPYSTNSSQASPPLCAQPSQLTDSITESQERADFIHAIDISQNSQQSQLDGHSDSIGALAALLASSDQAETETTSPAPESSSTQVQVPINTEINEGDSAGPLAAHSLLSKHLFERAPKELEGKDSIDHGSFLDLAPENR